MILTPRKAIRAKCLDCCCGHPSEVRDCTVKNCPLYPHRFGKRPKMDANTPVEAIGEKCGDSPTFSQQMTKRKAPLCDNRPK